jgi:signal transduction histidine kinase/CheY-like chemotaxis protein
MVKHMVNELEQRVLLCAPFGKDAELACHVLDNAGVTCCVCKDLAELLHELNKGAGVILTVEEILSSGASAPLSDFLAHQPTWSDLPILVLTKPGGESPWAKSAYERLGNLTLLERPVRAATLVSAVRSALRARLRQYEVRTADRRKDEFLAMLGHELRNPLAPISVAAKLLELAPSNPDRVKMASSVIARQVTHMTSLIDDLLDVARVTRGLITLNKEQLDIRDIITEAVEQASPLIIERGHHLALQLPPESALVLGDRKRLIQVVANLLSNASKYTAENGNIVLGLQVRADTIVLDISDDGIGISPEMVTQVFDLFAQAERTPDRSLGGLGLGLALVKSLVSSHGGSVHANSKGLGEGSTFTIHLPRLASQSGVLAPAASTMTASIAANPLRIMVVDDNRDVANTLRMFLHAIGHDVSVDYEATSAIKRAKRMSPQVCMLDIGLPDIDGNALARQLRAMPETEGAVLIAVTGYNQEQEKVKSMAAGFDYHFVKPLDTAKLLSLLAEIAATE